MEFKYSHNDLLDNDISAHLEGPGTPNKEMLA